MLNGSLRYGFVALFVGALGCGGVARAADAKAEAAGKSPAVKQSSSSSSRPSTRTGAAAKGPLPDPVLLDGSSQPAEKRPEHGMIGDFELPGDENVRNQKVGGPPQQQQQGGGEQSQQQGAMAGMQGGEQSQQQQQGGGAQQQSQQQQQGSGNAAAGQQDPNAKAEGMQVAQLETDPEAQNQSGGGGPGQKPQPVSIGDKAMQIKTVSNSPNIVGMQQPSTAQQMETKVGGGKGSTQVPAGRNAAERGRAIPAGL